MPALSSAQILVALWLLAVAAAPAATALMNGSLTPFAAEKREARCCVVPLVAENREEDAKKTRPAKAKAVAIEAAEFTQPELAGTERAVSLSRMNTDVQRHKPRGR